MPVMRKAIAVPFLSLALAATPLAAAEPSIVFMAYRSSGPTDLMVADADGSSFRVLLPSADTSSAFSVHRWPRWSSDGRRIVFVSQMPAPPPTHPELDPLGPGIYMIDSDGTSLCKVTALHNAQEPYPAPAPAVPPGWQGSKIVYADLVVDRPCGARLCGQWDLFLVDAACGAPEPVNLSRTPDRDELFASWSPDGRRIAASVLDLRDAAPGPRSRSIAIFDLDGTALTEIANLGRPDGCLSAIFPDWSRNGERIAACCVGISTSSLWFYSLGARSWMPLATGSETGLRPSWSPDDASIVFDREDDPALSIIAANVRGASRHLLAPPQGSAVRYIGPDWKRKGT